MILFQISGKKVLHVFVHSSPVAVDSNTGNVDSVFNMGKSMEPIAEDEEEMEVETTRKKCV